MLIPSLSNSRGHVFFLLRFMVPEKNTAEGILRGTCLASDWHSPKNSEAIVPALGSVEDLS